MLLKFHPPAKALLVPWNRWLGGPQSRLECFEEEKNLLHMQALKHSSLVIQPAGSYEHQLHYAGSVGTVESNKKKSFKLLNRQMCCYSCIRSVLSNLV